MSAKVRTALYAGLLSAASALCGVTGWAADPSPPADPAHGGPPSFISVPHHAGLAQPLVKGWHTFPLKEMPNWHALPIERKLGGVAPGGGVAILAPYILGSTNFGLTQQSAASLPINTSASATLAGYNYKGETAIVFAPASSLLVGGFNELAAIGCGSLTVPCAPGATVAGISSPFDLAPTSWTTSVLPLNLADQSNCLFFGIFCNILGYDPSLAVSSDQQTIYFSYGVCGADFDLCVSGSLMIGTSTDGKTWANHEVTSTVNNAFLFFDDKPYMATDPTNSLKAYVAFDRNANVSNNGVVTQTQVVYLVETPDGGADWSNPTGQYTTLVTGNAVSDPNNPQGRVIFAMPAVSNDGSKVYVVWIDYSGLNAQLMLNTCAPALPADPTITPVCDSTKAHSIQLLNTPLQADIGCNGGRAITATPSIAVAPSGRLYVTFADVPPGASTYSILLIFSDNGGATWSGPYRLNDDKTTWQIRQHYFPALSVVGSTVYVSWLDRRNDPSDCLTQTFSTYSDGTFNGGGALNVAHNLNVSAGPGQLPSSTLNRSNYNGNANGPGDYSGTVGLVLGNNLQYPLWPVHPRARSAVFNIFTEEVTRP